MHPLLTRVPRSIGQVRMGRAAVSAGGITAPFVDSRGVPLLEGGGTLLVGRGFGWAAGGGQSVLRTQSASVNQNNASVLLVLHAYDGVSGDPWVQVSQTLTQCRATQGGAGTGAYRGLVVAIETDSRIPQIVELRWPANTSVGSGAWPHVVPWMG